MGDLEGVELGDERTGLLPEREQVRGFDLVDALDLLDHELGVGDDAEVFVAVVEGVLEDAEEAGVFGEVVGAVAEEDGELGEGVSGVVGEDGTVAGGAGVAARTAVAVGGDPGGGGFRVDGEEGGLRHWG